MCLVCAVPHAFSSHEFTKQDWNVLAVARRSTSKKATPCDAYHVYRLKQRQPWNNSIMTGFFSGVFYISLYTTQPDVQRWCVSKTSKIRTKKENLKKQVFIHLVSEQHFKKQHTHRKRYLGHGFIHIWALADWLKLMARH